MNNQPKIEAYQSFYRQAKEYFATGHITEARESFIKAAEIANDISVTSSSYDVRMEYHNLAVKILDFVKRECVTKRIVEQPAERIPEEPKETEFVPQKQSGDRITFDDVAGLDEVKEQIRFKVISPMQKPEIAAKYNVKAGGKILLYGPPGTG